MKNFEYKGGDMIIPALDRGLLVIDFLINSKNPRKYTEIKDRLDNITDASLNRLLKSLFESGYILKNADGLYQYSRKVEQWRNNLQDQTDFKGLVKNIVEKISNRLRESAAFAMLSNEYIGIIASKSYPDSISVIDEKGILHFETDHAAALAIMDAMPRKNLRNKLKSSYCEFSSLKELETGLNDFKKETCYADRSRARKGVSRMAVGINTNNLPGALFICLPTARMETDFAKFAKVLNQYKNMLEEQA